jgi:N-acetylglucosaminyldiphosphoundecaprenol N-acetyl-beta-D-mannosaminyltransferase
MASSRNTLASLVQADIAPPLAPRVGDIDPPNQTDYVDQVEHVEFLDLPFCMWTQAGAIEAISARRGAPYRYVVTPNAYHIVAAHDDPARLLPIYRAAWLSLCDSRIVRALARLDGRALPLVTGSDLVAALLAKLNTHDPQGTPTRLLVVGPPRGAEVALRAAYPKLTFEIMPAPAALARSAEPRLAVARACLERPWDILLLCVGCPAQELIAQHLAELGRKSGVALCVGAAIDFLTGARVRAPFWLQRLGLEWAYRLSQEPGRLWHRYLVQSPKIFRIFMMTRLRRGR